jgi:hypothetical protein
MSDSSFDLIDQISRQPGDLPVTDVDAINLEDQKILNALKGERFKSDTRAREYLAVWTAITVSIWLYFVMVILMSNTNVFKLSETVLITLLGTTTLNVLGLSFIVLRGHFSGGESASFDTKSTSPSIKRRKKKI